MTKKEFTQQAETEKRELAPLDVDMRLQHLIDTVASLEKTIKNIELRAEHKEVFNSEEAARYLGVTRSHLYRLTSSNEMPYFSPNGKLIYFERDELDKWIRRNPIPSRSQQEAAVNSHLMRKGKL